MVKYQGYKRYKDSGVKWLGEIPKHWDIWKVTHGFKNVGSGTTPKSDNSTFYDGDIPWITTSELREILIEDTTQKVTQEALKNYSALKVYPKGSIAIAMYGATIGRLGILGIDATVNQACCVFSDSKIFHLPFFYYWLWMHRPNLIALSAGGGQPNLSQDDLKQLRLPTPPIDEQQGIARFLDYKTKQIDDLITKKETLIEKLDEKRTALISHAVTKGLDPNVPMKDSGVEWLGEIPKHWEVIRIKRAFILQRGVDIRQEDQTEGVVPVVSSGGIASYHNVAYAKSPGVLVGRKGTLGSVHYVEVDYWPHDTTLWVFEFYDNNPRFIYYKLLSMNLKDWDTGSANPTLNRNLIHPLKIPWTSSEEQGSIVKYLDNKTSEIEQQKAKIQQAIELLKEYRTALITNAVTGKIDVRQVPIP
ncbi:restriction modification system DNA specificity domain protein [Nostoc sp. NIES-3756]|uniref:restriction endonuclease subunit S n=1 Tax=Nostoc sp. NIES-3756 TaxID=1751286 RepID=UPI00071EEA18|nr:restriction endonuclease subunit S [Nostoc sp. NIES-3756]BAT53745.1 restriction modification system DNA specificity domain protein [Nostoc sp. NIES-3756]